MIWLGRPAWALLIGVIGLACTAGPVGAPPTGSGAPPAATAPNPTLVMVSRGEPPSLAARPLQTGAGGTDRITPLFNALLDLVDERGEAHPYLAEALPQLDSASWRVEPDGHMETAYRLRPGLTWHDGTPLAGEDFGFAWRVYATPELGLSTTPPVSLMEEVLAPDPQMVVIRWRQVYPFAGVLQRGFQPLPRHLLESAFLQADWPSFATHPYWTRDFVGLGPYRVSQWEPGAAIDATGFDGHALGRPRIDRVQVRFIGDANAALAALLSGDVHFSVDVAISQAEGSVLEREWAPRGGGTVLFNPIQARVIQIQHRPDAVGPPELRDVRLRRALAHALDKDELNEVLQNGRATLTDALTSPSADYAPLVSAAISHYPHDPRRSQQLLEEMGLVPGAEGLYAAADGRPVRLEVLGLTGPANERETALLVDSFKRAGIEAYSRLLPVVQVSDVRLRASAPGILPIQPTEGERGLGGYSSQAIPTPENRWLGANYGGWSNAAFDRGWAAYNTRLDRGERVQQIVQMERAFSDEVGGIPFYYNVTVNAYVASLRGPTLRPGPEAGLALAQVYRWEWR